jgi:coenzyme PQQ biosynthesis protein PqqD
MRLKKKSILELVPVPRKGLELTHIEGEGLLYSYEKETMVYLNDSAVTVWRLCDGKRTVREITDLLASTYTDAAEKIYIDVSDTIEHLRQVGVLELGDA